MNQVQQIVATGGIWRKRPTLAEKPHLKLRQRVDVVTLERLRDPTARLSGSARPTS